MPHDEDNIEQQPRADERFARITLFDALIESFPGLLVVVGSPPDLRVLAANKRFAQMLPEPYRSGSPFVGLSFRDLGGERSAQNEAVTALILKVHQSGEPILHQQSESDDPVLGKSYWNWSIIPVEDHGGGDERQIMIVAHEVTNEVVSGQRAHAATLKADRHARELETVINYMADGVMICDAQGLVVKVNPACEWMLGRGATAGAIPARYSELFNLYTLSGKRFPTEELPLVKAISGETVTGVQILVKRPGSEDAIISASGSPWFDEAGRIAGAVCVFRDVTQEKVTERLKDEFLSVVSHELRTPLTAIIGYSDLMLRGVHGPLTERHAGPVRSIKSNAWRLLHLINDLLDVSKLESGTVELSAEPVDLGQAIARTISRTNVLAVAAVVTVTNHVHTDGFPNVLASETKMQQIIENLLANAIKFTPPGGLVTFEARLTPLGANDPKITEMGEQFVRQAGRGSGKQQSVIVSVTDTGRGLEKDQLDRIWDRFYQVDATAKRRSGGAGLGLAITRSLVELHGGRVWASSPGLNRGSTFSFSLPIALAGERPLPPAQPLPARTEAASAVGQGPVLVVEDQPDQREIMRDMLESEGYRVVLAENGEQALQLAAKVRPVAVLLDVLLPPSDGWEVLRRIRSNPDTKNIPVLIASVVDQQNFGKRLGADDYLVKPLDAARLRGALQRVTGVGGNE